MKLETMSHNESWNIDSEKLLDFDSETMRSTKSSDLAIKELFTLPLTLKLTVGSQFPDSITIVYW